MRVTSRAPEATGTAVTAVSGQAHTKACLALGQHTV